MKNLHAFALFFLVIFFSAGREIRGDWHICTMNPVTLTEECENDNCNMYCADKYDHKSNGYCVTGGGCQCLYLCQY
ncbi:hypothetical protein ACOSQ4_017081 [Xanthoceras sorbifolium]